MTRRITTLMLENAACVGGTARTIEKSLREVPGVLHAYVNPSTEAAYVEYDSDRCKETDLDAAVASVGVHALHPTAPGRHTVVPALPSGRMLMPQTKAGSKSLLALTVFAVIAAFFLLAEHRAHVLGVLPFLFLLACPLLHRFGHAGHGGHGRRSGAGDHHGNAASAQEGIARDRAQRTRSRNDHHSSAAPQGMSAMIDYRRTDT